MRGCVYSNMCVLTLIDTLWMLTCILLRLVRGLLILCWWIKWMNVKCQMHKISKYFVRVRRQIDVKKFRQKLQFSPSNQHLRTKRLQYEMSRSLWIIIYSSVCVCVCVFVYIAARSISRRNVVLWGCGKLRGSISYVIATRSSQMNAEAASDVQGGSK